jgi:hypothetical protein
LRPTHDYDSASDYHYYDDYDYHDNYDHYYDSASDYHDNYDDYYDDSASGYHDNYDDSGSGYYDDYDLAARACAGPRCVGRVGSFLCAAKWRCGQVLGAGKPGGTRAREYQQCGSNRFVDG